MIPAILDFIYTFTYTFLTILLGFYLGRKTAQHDQADR